MSQENTTDMVQTSDKDASGAEIAPQSFEQDELNGIQPVTYKAAVTGREVTITAKLVRDVIAQGNARAPMREVLKVMAIAQARGLDLLAGDATVMCYKSKRTGKVTATLIVAKDYWIKVAEMKPSFRGYEAGIIVFNPAASEVVSRCGANLWPGETLLGGYCVVHDARFASPFRHEVSFGEYFTGDGMWQEKPATMIRKVALAQTLREIYSANLSGMYDSSEIQVDVEESEV